MKSPLTSTWPRLGCDDGLEEGEYRENYLCVTVSCTIIMVHKDTSSFTGRSTVLGFDSLGLALYLRSDSVSSIFMVLSVWYTFLVTSLSELMS